MSVSGSDYDNFDQEQDGGSFSIKPYQYEPRVNSEDADNNPEGSSGDESMGSDKEANPRLQNSDWYVVCRFLVYCNISTGIDLQIQDRNKLVLTQLWHSIIFVYAFSFLSVIGPNSVRLHKIANMRNEFFYNLFIGKFIHEAVQASLAAWMFYQFHRFTGRCSSVYFKTFTSTKENINL